MHHHAREMTVWLEGNASKAVPNYLHLGLFGEEDGEPSEFIDIVCGNGRVGVDALGVPGHDIPQRCEEADAREEGAVVPPYGIVAVVLMGYLDGGHQRCCCCWFLCHGDFSSQEMKLTECKQINAFWILHLDHFYREKMINEGSWDG